MLMMQSMSWMEKNYAVRELQLNMLGLVQEVEEAEDVTLTDLAAAAREMIEETPHQSEQKIVSL